MEYNINELKLPKLKKILPEEEKEDQGKYPWKEEEKEKLTDYGWKKNNIEYATEDEANEN